MINKKLSIFIIFAIAVALFFLTVNFYKDSSPDTLACTEELFKCDDGAWVGRTGDDCSFNCPNIGDKVTLNLYIQDKEAARTIDCGITIQKNVEVIKDGTVIEDTLKYLFSEELINYGDYKSVIVEGETAKVMLENNSKIVGLSSCEIQHLTSVLNDTLEQYVESVEIYTSEGLVIF